MASKTRTANNLNNSNKRQHFNINDSRHGHLAVKHKYDFHALCKQSPKNNPVATFFYIFFKKKVPNPPTERNADLVLLRTLLLAGGLEGLAEGGTAVVGVVGRRRVEATLY